MVIKFWEPGECADSAYAKKLFSRIIIVHICEKFDFCQNPRNSRNLATMSRRFAKYEWIFPRWHNSYIWFRICYFRGLILLAKHAWETAFCGWERRARVERFYRSKTSWSSNHPLSRLPPLAPESLYNEFSFLVLFQHGLAHLIRSINLIYILRSYIQRCCGKASTFIFWGTEKRRNQQRNIIKGDTGKTMGRAMWNCSERRRAKVQKEFERIRSLFERVSVCA